MPAKEGTSIVVKLDDLLHERRTTLTELAERVGLTLADPQGRKGQGDPLLDAGGDLPRARLPAGRSAGLSAGNGSTRTDLSGAKGRKHD